MIKNLSEKPIAELQKEQAEKWEKEDLLGKCISTREGMTPFIFYERAGQRLTASLVSIT